MTDPVIVTSIGMVTALGQVQVGGTDPTPPTYTAAVNRVFMIACWHYGHSTPPPTPSGWDLQYTSSNLKMSIFTSSAPVVENFTSWIGLMRVGVIYQLDNTVGVLSVVADTTDPIPTTAPIGVGSRPLYIFLTECFPPVGSHSTNWDFPSIYGSGTGGSILFGGGTFYDGINPPSVSTLVYYGARFVNDGISWEHGAEPTGGADERAILTFQAYEAPVVPDGCVNACGWLNDDYGVCGFLEDTGVGENAAIVEVYSGESPWSGQITAYVATTETPCPGIFTPANAPDFTGLPTNFYVSGLPPLTTLVFDSSTERILLRDAAGNYSDGSRFIHTNDNSPFGWINTACGSSLCVCVSSHPCSTDALAKVTITSVRRQL